MPMAISFRGLIFVLVILPTTMCGWLGMAVPAFLLLQFAPSYYRWWVHVVGKFWFSHVVFLIEVIFGVRFRFYGDAIAPGESALVISNHRTRIDWMLLWSYFLRIDALHPLRIVLKHGLKKVPFFGWAMQCMNFIFLRRAWADDEAYLKRTFAYTRRVAASDPARTMVLLFPEGTDLSESSLTRANAWAKTHRPDLTAPRVHTLHPRTTGFSHFVRGLGSSIDSILDVTMAYVDYTPGERPNEKSLLSGRMPREVHVCVKRHAIRDLAAAARGGGGGDRGSRSDSGDSIDDAFLRRWCTEIFDEKEANLAEFYSEGGEQGAEAAGDDATTTFCGAAPMAAAALPVSLAPALALTGLFWFALWGVVLRIAPHAVFWAVVPATAWTRQLLWAGCALALAATFQTMTSSALGGIDMLELKREEERAGPEKAK